VIGELVDLKKRLNSLLCVDFVEAEEGDEDFEEDDDEDADDEDT
jgi:hypothetical protein